MPLVPNKSDGPVVKDVPKTPKEPGTAERTPSNTALNEISAQEKVARKRKVQQIRVRRSRRRTQDQERILLPWISSKRTDGLLPNVGDFLVRQAVKSEQRTSAIDQFIISVRINTGPALPAPAEPETKDADKKSDKETQKKIEEDKKAQNALSPFRHVLIHYSRRQRLYYVTQYTFKFAFGLIEYHRRHEYPIDDEGSLIRRPINRADWQLNHEQISRVKKLGDGAFGDVHLGTLRTGIISYREVAIKTINGIISADENEKLFQEAMLMKKFIHPNVVQLVGVASNSEPLMIVMEIAPGGSVLSAVTPKAGKPEPNSYTRIKYCLGAARGMEYLASKEIVHRDIAARNCLIGKNDEAKISDFGLSIVGGHKKEKKLKKVPFRYLAPETLTTGVYNYMTDVWTFGVFMWEVFHGGRDPYDEIEDVREIKKRVKVGYRLVNTSPLCPLFLWELAQNCWDQEANQRPTFTRLVERIESQKEAFNEEPWLTRTWQHTRNRLGF